MAVHVGGVHVVGEHDGVLGPGPDADGAGLRVVGRSVVARLRDGQPDGAAGTAARNLGAVRPAVGVERERHRAAGLGAQASAGGEAGQATAAVAAHGRERAVGVAVAHPEVGVGRVVERQQAVGADAGAARAEAARHRRQLVVGKAQEAVVEDDEVVAGAAHLGERDDERRALGAGEEVGRHGRRTRRGTGRSPTLAAAAVWRTPAVRRALPG